MAIEPRPRATPVGARRATPGRPVVEMPVRPPTETTAESSVVSRDTTPNLRKIGRTCAGHGLQLLVPESSASTVDEKDRRTFRGYIK